MIMEFQHVLIVLCVFSYLTFVEGQGPVYLFGDDVVLQCAENIIDEHYAWTDESVDPLVIIYVVNDAGDQSHTNTAAGIPKYQNFDIVNNYPNSVDLIIRSLGLDDAGSYGCSFFGAVPAKPGQQVDIEALPVSVSIYCTRPPSDACPPSSEMSSEFTCTCTAIGAYPDDLQFELTSPAVAGSTSPPSSSNERSGAYNYQRDATITPTVDIDSVTCTLEGYSNTLPENDRSATYNFVPVQTCEILIVPINNCEGVDLTCDCNESANPAITSYRFFDGNGVEIDEAQDTNKKTINLPPVDGNYMFGCKGCNGVNFGDNPKPSGSVPCVPIMDTTTITGPSAMSMPTTTVISEPTPTNNPTLNDVPYNCSHTGLIVACTLEAVIIIVLILVIIYLITHDRLGYRGKDEPRFTKRIDENNESENTAYMDLQELQNDTNSKVKTFEVPQQNVQLVSLLHGKGMLQYHKALFMGAKGNQEATVKTLSGDSTLKVNKTLQSEVKTLLELSNDNSIVKLLGWCDTVPNYVIYEYLNGGNLSDHLNEEFSPHKVHQYGNTKQRRFEVTEKGPVERLPNYALQVARGLKFLTKNKFLNPGLRAKKVLLDAAGRCKLYDFVSLQNANDWTSFLWNESIPYQWLPPEFLFLETISTAGDIWSFGVLLWEIFSYGSEPYIGLKRSDVEKNLREKEQLPLPDNCPGAIWQLMITCWEPTVKKRPNIDDVTSKLASMCNEDKEYQQI